MKYFYYNDIFAQLITMTLICHRRYQYIPRMVLHLIYQYMSRMVLHFDFQSDSVINSYNAEYFLYKPWRQNSLFNLKSLQMS